MLAPQTILNEGPPPDFQISVANGHLETLSATVDLQFKVGDNLVRERFIVMANLTSPLFGLLFLRTNSTILDMRQGVLNFSFFSMQLKHADNTYSNINEPLLKRTEILIQPGKQTVIHIKSQVQTEKEVTGIIQSSLDS